MKLLLDEGTPLRSAAMLRKLGYEAAHVLALNLGGRSDELLIAHAQTHDLILVVMMRISIAFSP